MLNDLALLLLASSIVGGVDGVYKTQNEVDQVEDSSADENQQNEGEPKFEQ